MNSIERMKKDAEAIFFAGLEAVEPEKRVKTLLIVNKDELFIQETGRSFNLKTLENIYLIGAGKAACPMAKGVEEVLSDRIKEGIIITNYGNLCSLKYSVLMEAGHPIPDKNSLIAGRKIRKMALKANEKDLIICVLSGGGSSLMVLPPTEISLGEKQKITELLLKSGAQISEINAVRKHISLLKGGNLARLTYPAKTISLILSDVVGDRIDTIASGPLHPDLTTFQDVVNIFKKYELEKEIPESIKNHIEKGIRGEIEETPKPGDKIFDKVFNVIVGNNLIALEASAKKAKDLGYNPLILSSLVEGETFYVAKVHTAIAKEILKSSNPIPPPACILSGGETTVTVKGTGKGGRNQEFALVSAIEIENEKHILVLSGGTDGIDGITDAAGAFADSDTLNRAKKKKLNPKRYLENNDSHNFFRKLGDLFITGPTQTNVMDLRIILVRRE